MWHTTRTQLSRRTFLQAAGVGAAAVGASVLAGGEASAASRPGAVSADQLWAWTQTLASFGTRLTGSTAHADYTDWLAGKFEQAGLEVQQDRLTFTRWSPARWSLTVDGKPADVAFYWPYSGVTPAGGITAPLIYLGLSPLNAVAWGAAAGKIAVVEVATPPLPAGALFPETGRYAPDMASPDALRLSTGVTDAVAAPLLEMAAKAGVLGVVCIRTGVSDALAKDQYSPFTTGYQNCPALWVGPTAGKELRAKALLSRPATLVLDATLTPNAATNTIWGVLPGYDPTEAVVVNTHTDGPNVAEENGGLGLLALAKEFGSIPRASRRRSLIFVATTGHFQLPQFMVNGGQSASRWIADHPELIDGTTSKAVAALTLEHLGCMEWEDNALLNQYGPNGRKDVAYCFATTKTMRQAYLNGSVDTANDRTITALPAFYFGEGSDFHAAGIATASLIPGPTYLFAAPKDGGLNRLDKTYMHGQVRTFANVMRMLDTLSADTIGTPLL